MRANIAFLFVTLCFNATAIARALKPTTRNLDAVVHNRDVLTIAGEVYHMVERQFSSAVASRNVLETDTESTVFSSSQVDKRAKSRPGGGANKRVADLETRTRSRGNGGADKRSSLLEKREKARGKGGAGKRNAELEGRAKTRGPGGAGGRAVTVDKRTKNRGNGGAGR